MTLLQSCSGGGGGDGGETSEPPPSGETPPTKPGAPTIEYQGLLDAAILDETTARNFAADVSTMAALPAELTELFLEPISGFADEIIDETTEGAAGGQLVIRGERQSVDLARSTGWLWFEYTAFAERGRLIDGRVVQIFHEPQPSTSHDIEFQFTNLRLAEGDADRIYHGTIRDTAMDAGDGYLRTIVTDLMVEDALTGKSVWAEGLTTRRSRHFAFSDALEHSGRVYVSDAGYVDVATDSPQILISGDDSPDRGGALRASGSNGSTGVVPLSAEHVAIVEDLDGDGADERFARLRRAELLAGEPPTDTNAPAVANAGASRLVEVGVPFELNGLLSRDDDRSFLTAEWALAVRPLSSAATLDLRQPLTPSFTPDVAGHYLFTLKAVDPDGDAYDAVHVQAASSVSTNRGVRVRLDRPRPTALGRTVLLDASMSRREDLSDSAPLSIRYDWQLAGPLSSSAALADTRSPATSFVPDVPGFYTITVSNDITVNYASAVTKVVGYGTGFQYFPAAHMETAARPEGRPLLVDVDSDGLLDIVTVGYSERGAAMIVYRGIGDGLFAEGVDFPVVISDANELITGDLDSDGYSDVALDGPDDVYVLHGGASLPQSLHEIPLDRGPDCGFAMSLFIHIGDTDADGRDDLLVSDRCTSDVSIWRQDAAGALDRVSTQQVPELREYPHSFGDLNDDGRPDLVVRREGTSQTRPALLVFTSTPDGMFVLSHTLEAVQSQLYVIGDVSGDGREDLVVRETPYIRIFEQIPGGGFKPSVDYPAAIGFGSPLLIADIDGDDRADVVFEAHDDLAFALKREDAGFDFVSLPQGSRFGSGGAVAAGDIDQDGGVDLLRPRYELGDTGFSVRLSMPGTE